jgi:hypothetical protein
VSRRRGTSRWGCLLLLVIVGVAAYYGAPVVKMYWRYYRYDDAFREQARYAEQATDEEILKQLNATADTLGLPPAARAIKVVRKPHRITISAEYSEYWEAPYFGRDLSFYPYAENEY